MNILELQKKLLAIKELIEHEHDHQDFQVHWDMANELERIEDSIKYYTKRLQYNIKWIKIHNKNNNSRGIKRTAQSIKAIQRSRIRLSKEAEELKTKLIYYTKKEYINE